MALCLYLLKVTGKDMVSRVGGVPARDKNTIPFPASSPCAPWHGQSPPAAAASSHWQPRQAWLVCQLMGPPLALTPFVLAAGASAMLLVKNRALTQQLGSRG